MVKGRLFSWLQDWSPEDLRGTLKAIYLAPVAGAPMEAADAVHAVAGQGLARDRYANGAGHWRATDGCQVTLVTLEDLQAAEQQSGLCFSRGEHRRNLVVAGIPVAAFRDCHIRIGETRLRFHRLRPPCGYLERMLGPGTMKALAHRGGVGLTVVEDGSIRVGDPVIVEPRRARS
ncbi:MAG: sulfurase [Gammaproteobacteria bacterium]|nr:sulfurase [Gammaproteobacteria bacterium]